VLAPLALVAALHLFGQPADGVSVSTDASTYAPGDPIQITIFNAGPDRITRGGLACTDIWPFGIEQRQPDSSWLDVPAPRSDCLAIEAALFGPGESQTRTIDVSLDPGTYHVIYVFDDVDNGIQDVAASDPFDITE
jgi:hypothetical protein